jgi:DNA polymerase I-like protein with 3'-5' exonuclease and polymerase domains
MYHEDKRRVIWAGMDLSHTGIAVDEDTRATHERHWQSEVERLGHALDAGAGMKLVAKKGLSNPAIHRYFYEVLKCKERRKRGKVTADEVAIRRLMLAYKRARPIGQLILDFRQAAKHLEFLNGARVDSDGRLRSLYKPMTKTGRYMASTTPVGTGTNGQNIMGSVRDIFIASPE